MFEGNNDSVFVRETFPDLGIRFNFYSWIHNWYLAVYEIQGVLNDKRPKRNY